jgi:hypothetical protein
MPPVMMQRCRVRSATQGDQKAKGQDRPHRFVSSPPLFQLT